jgi:hypothetical protein
MQGILDLWSGSTEEIYLSYVRIRGDFAYHRIISWRLTSLVVRAGKPENLGELALKIRDSAPGDKDVG